MEQPSSRIQVFKTGTCMAKKNRPSVLKRQREAEKRQRQTGKAAEAALKRERRMERKSEQSQAPPGEEMPDKMEPLDPSPDPAQNPK